MFTVDGKEREYLDYDELQSELVKSSKGINVHATSMKLLLF